MATLLVEKENYIEAEKFTRQAINLQPNYIQAINNLAIILRNTSKQDEAEFWIKKSINIDNENSDTYSIFSDIKVDKRKYSEAEAMMRKSLALKDSFKGNAKLGEILQNRGKLEESEFHIIKSLKINPSFAISYYYLSLFKNVKKNASIFEYLFNDQILEEQNIEDKINIYFARANYLHKTKKYVDSAKYLKIANDLNLKKNKSEYKIIIEEANLIRTKSDKYKIKESYEIEDQSIFIVGMPRSGSTLIENILSVNNKVTSLGENEIFELTFKEWIKNEEISLPKLYFDNLKEFSSNKKITTNKLLYNYKYAGVICSQIPSAKIIFCYRNPLDNLLSLYRANFNKGNNYSSSLEDAANLYVNHKEIMDHYKSRYPKNIYELNYDLLVSKPTNEIKKILNWLDWKWNNKYLNSHQNMNTISTASKIEVRSPINNNSVGQWERYKDLLSPAIRIFKEAKLKY